MGLMRIRSRSGVSSEMCGSRLAAEERPLLAFQHWVHQPPTLDESKYKEQNAKLFLIMLLVSSTFCSYLESGQQVSTRIPSSESFGVNGDPQFTSPAMGSFVNRSPLAEVSSISYVPTGINGKVLLVLQGVAKSND